ncbi:hypothetical protein QBC45DRAFT_401759 [Copromyces sp. CBS 386.78]|nr:hypothetical protein QBC45DRAFT_401759 [Copromyces sp. CBS 386.78]
MTTSAIPYSKSLLQPYPTPKSTATSFCNSMLACMCAEQPGTSISVPRCKQGSLAAGGPRRNDGVLAIRVAAPMQIPCTWGSINLSPCVEVSPIVSPGMEMGSPACWEGKAGVSRIGMALLEGVRLVSERVSQAEVIAISQTRDTYRCGPWYPLHDLERDKPRGTKHQWKLIYAASNENLEDKQYKSASLAESSTISVKLGAPLLSRGVMLQPARFMVW